MTWLEMDYDFLMYCMPKVDPAKGFHNFIFPSGMILTCNEASNWYEVFSSSLGKTIYGF